MTLYNIHYSRGDYSTKWVFYIAGDEESIVELTRRLHHEIDRNSQIDERLWGYLRERREGGVGGSERPTPSGASSRGGDSAEVPPQLQVRTDFGGSSNTC